MDIGDVIEVSVRQDLDGEEMFNVFHVAVLNGSSPITDVATRVINQWITTHWQNLVSTALTFVEVTVRNLFDDTEQAIVPVALDGTLAGDVLPPHDAAQISMATGNPTIAGSKRFGGANEGAQFNGKWNSIYLDALDDFVNNVLTTALIGVGGIPLYLYTIVKRIKYTTSTGTISYRLPESIAELIGAIVTAGVPNDNVRTQKSRDFQE